MNFDFRSPYNPPYPTVLMTWLQHPPGDAPLPPPVVPVDFTYPFIANVGSLMNR
jgi:hypothetical protein